jgi:hypothetical protein
MYHVYFPEELLELRNEIQHHPELVLILEAQPQTDIYIHICEIAAYCDVLVLGTYTHNEILELCKMLLWKLKEKRSILVLPVGIDTTPVKPPEN